MLETIKILHNRRIADNLLCRKRLLLVVAVEILEEQQRR